MINKAIHLSFSPKECRMQNQVPIQLAADAYASHYWKTQACQLSASLDKSRFIVNQMYRINEDDRKANEERIRELEKKVDELKKQLELAKKIEEKLVSDAKQLNTTNNDLRTKGATFERYMEALHDKHPTLTGEFTFLLFSSHAHVPMKRRKRI